jgi:hypothetical protein
MEAAGQRRGSYGGGRVLRRGLRRHVLRHVLRQPRAAVGVQFSHGADQEQPMPALSMLLALLPPPRHAESCFKVASLEARVPRAREGQRQRERDR